MSKQEDVNLNIITIDRKEPSQLEFKLIVIQDHVIHIGSWMDFIETYIQGLVMGLEIANYNVVQHTYHVKDDLIFEKVQKGEINLEEIAKNSKTQNNDL